MKKIKSICDQINRIMYILNGSQKKYGCIVLLMTFGGAILEMFGVSVIIPLVQVLLTPDQLLQNKYIRIFINIFNLETVNQVVAGIIILVIALYVFKNLYLILLSLVRSKYSCKVQRELSVQMLDSYMKRDYEFFLNKNTGDLIRGVTTDITGVYSVIYQGLRIITEVLTLVCICVYICLCDWIMATVMIILAIICLLIIVFVFRKYMGILGEKNWKYNAELNQHILHVFQGIKEVLVMQKQKYFKDSYEKTYIKRQKCEIGQVVGAESPAYIIEALCVSGVLISISIRVNGMESAQAFIPTLAAFAVAAFRILPSLGRLSSSFNQLTYMLPSLDAVYTNIAEVRQQEEETDIKEEVLTHNRLQDNTLKKEIRLENICWKYANTSSYVLEGVNMVISKGQSVALVGQSGAGKTTLADLLLGILKPQKGVIKMDGTDINDIPDEWRRAIGYVPQSIYLTEQSIMENVAFGVEKKDIDENRVRKALEQAQLLDVIKQLPDDIYTAIGERGIKLSGGQRQRIAIARALYNNPEIVIFDEATAALDNETERAVMESIEALRGEKTLVIIAHRLTTIEKCDVIYEVSNKNVTIRKYEELIK